MQQRVTLEPGSPTAASGERSPRWRLPRRLGLGVAAVGVALTSFVAPAHSPDHVAAPPAVTAEATPHQKVLAAEELPGDETLHQQLQNWLGGLAVNAAVQASPEVKMPPATSLANQIDRAIAGDEEAYNSVLTNARTTLIEAYFKTGNITRVVNQLDANGELQQYSQTMRSVYENALKLRPNRIEELQEVTQLEALNGHRIEHYARTGLLKNYNYVVYSLVPDNASEEALGKNGDGYFTDTLTYVAQATTQEGEEIVTESGFIAGTANGQRCDFTAVNAVRQHFGQAPISRTKEGLSRGMLVPKSLMPGGVIDLVELGDQALGPATFFGQQQTPENYEAFKKKCATREANLNQVAQKIVADLLLARQEGQIISRMDAIEAMYDIVKKHAVDHAIDNEAIDASVLGKEAEGHIAIARRLIKAGDASGGAAARDRAQQSAEITACGGGSTSQKDGKNGLGSSLGVTEKLRRLGEKITTNCPYCGTKDTSATVYKDEEGGAIECKTCNTVKDFCENQPKYKSKHKVNELRKLNNLPPIK